MCGQYALVYSKGVGRNKEGQRPKDVYDNGDESCGKGVKGKDRPCVVEKF